MFGKLATNIVGKDSKKAVSLPPPLTEIRAQFMYISRSACLLNHVQANVYILLGMPFGITTSNVAAPWLVGPPRRLPPTLAGQVFRMVQANSILLPISSLFDIVAYLSC